MKTPKGIRTNDADELPKAKRLAPNHKTGKERHTLYRVLDDNDEDDSEDFRPPRESALDYLDDED